MEKMVEFTHEELDEVYYRIKNLLDKLPISQIPHGSNTPDNK